MRGIVDAMGVMARAVARRSLRRVAAAGAALAIGLLGARARAEPRHEGIGVYGRFDHDLALSAGLGGGARVASAGPSAVGTLEARATYIHTAGLVVSGSFASGGGRAWSGLVAVDLRPLFLVSVFENRFTGDSFVDLVRDALGLEGGIGWDGAHPALVLGAGTELPLVRERDAGLFLRLGARVHLARTRWVGGADAGATFELGAILQAHGAVSAGLL